MDQPSARSKRERASGADISNNSSNMLAAPSSKRSKHSEADTKQAVDSLCERCATIDIGTALSRESPTFSGKLVKRLGRNPQWNIDSCALCRWLAHAEKFSLRRPLELRHYSSKRIDMGWKSVDINMLGLYYLGPFLVPHQKDAKEAAVIRRLEPSSIDFELLKSWLRLCDELHTKSCAVKESPAVPFMKLIDCNTNTIVPATNHPYVTLSYVWGEDSGPTEYSESLPKELPSTIRDSIIVTRNLGFRYLWIDRYCINQLVPDEASAQIRRMDLIYQNSKVTFLALGKDPTYGLPGAGKRPRTAQGYAQVGEYLLVSSPLDPQAYLNVSKWMTRGWTYQEALLSRRRLVFTDEQVYYECYGMHCCEALNFPLRSMHKKSLQCFKKPFCDGNNIGQFPRGVGSSPWEILSRIQEYSTKSLTKPTDILNGILGILRAFEQNIHGVRHLFGVPILPQPVGIRRQINTKGESSLWNSQIGFALGLCWDLKDGRIWTESWNRNPAPSFRRPGFPSWSWTGWFGVVNWEHTDKDLLWIDAGLQVKFELRDGQVIDWPSFHASYDKLSDYTSLSQYIIISAWTTRVKFLEHSQLSPRGANSNFCLARIELEDGGHLVWEFTATTREKFLPEKEYLGIYLVDREPKRVRKEQIIFHGPALLVVSKVKDRMERVGLGWVTGRNFEMFSADGISEHANKPRGLWPSSIRSRPQMVKAWQEIRLG